MSGSPMLRICVLGAAAVLAASTAFGQAKVGIIDSQKALAETAEVKKALATMEAKYKPRVDELQKLNADVQQLNNTLTTMAGKLTPQAQNETEVKLKRSQTDLQRKQEDLQADVDRERQDLIAKSGAQMQSIVEKMAADKGLDVLIDVTNAVWFKPALDVTKEATDAYDKAHPAK